MERKNEQWEWLFILALIIPVVILGKLRLHQRNLGLFLVISIISVTVVMIAYYCYHKHLLRKENNVSGS